MSFLRRPSYYKDFSCIASACTDSCCQQWEIDIDEDTLEFYLSVEGEFGERLRANICLPEGDEPAHFIQAEKERCPFLNEQNLCDIFRELGEEHLGWICTHHPRYYDWFTNGREAGLGLCCEEAARLVLTSCGGEELETIEEEGSEEGCEDASEEPSDFFEEQLENRLFELREELFRLVRGELPHDRKWDELAEKKAYVQEAYDNLMYGEPEEELIGEEEVEGSFSESFWNKETLRELIALYEELEINDPEWWKLLQEVKKTLPELLSKRSAFLAEKKECLREYDNLMIYFLFRYFLKGREDGCPADKLQFALLSTSMIELLEIHKWSQKGELSLWDRICIVKLYSKEIEYDEENMLEISAFSVYGKKQ